MPSPQDDGSHPAFAALSLSVPAIPVASRDETTLTGARAQSAAAQGTGKLGGDQLRSLREASERNRLKFQGITDAAASLWRIPSPAALVEQGRAAQEAGASDRASAGLPISCAYTQLLPAPPATASARGSLALSAARVAPSTDGDVHADVIFLPGRAATLLRPPCRLPASLPAGRSEKYTGREGHRAAPGVKASLEASRRSRLRRILNAIVRRRNEALPAAGEGPRDWPRFDASSLDAAGSDPGNGYCDEEGGQQLGAGKGPKRVLILMSDTGGGHRASAEALKATFELEFGDKYQVAVVDAWKDHTPYPFNQLPKSYSFLVKHESLWRVAFHSTRPRFVHQPQMAATGAFVAREMAKMLDIHRPDLIISVHPLMQHVPLRVLRSRGLLHRIPFTTVITDLTTCHPTWFHRLVTMCFCPTREVAQRALRAGLKPPQIRVHGLPIKPAFSQPPSLPVAKLRKELGMDPDLPAVLLIGGGEGMGPVEATARALAVTLKGETRFSGTWEPQRLEEALAALDSLAERERSETAAVERAALGGDSAPPLRHTASREQGALETSVVPLRHTLLGEGGALGGASEFRHTELGEGGTLGALGLAHAASREGGPLEAVPGVGRGRPVGAGGSKNKTDSGPRNGLCEFLTLLRALLEVSRQRAQGGGGAPGAGQGNRSDTAAVLSSPNSTAAVDRGSAQGQSAEERSAGTVASSSSAERTGSTGTQGREGECADGRHSGSRPGSMVLGLTTSSGVSRASGSLKQLVRPKGQLVVVCGRNKKLKATLESISWPLPVLVKGFVSNMPDLMAACNCIITKAGPGTIAESLIRGLPMVLNDFIAGQEVGNIPFVVDNGAGVFCNRPSEIAGIVAGWFGPRADELKAMAERAKEMARPDAVFRIVRDLDAIVMRMPLEEAIQLA